MTKIFGVDFSGAQNAGEKIWVSRAFCDENGLRFDFLQNAAALPDGQASREKSLAALVAFLERELCPGDVAGFDFPFALAGENLGQRSWREWIFSLERFSDADEFRSAFSDARRACDVRAKTPFSPLNIRLYRQTFHGMRDVLRPLLANGFRAAPFENPEKSAKIVAEICPASLLKREKLYLSYKGHSAAQRQNRETIWRELQAKFAFQASEAMAQICWQNSEGDALDAVISALRLARHNDFSARDELEKREGRVYF